MRSFDGTYKEDAAIFVCTGGFSGEALAHARRENIRTINAEQFIKLWIEHSHKMNDEDRGLFPLVPVYLLRPQE